MLGEARVKKGHNKKGTRMGDGLLLGEGRGGVFGRNFMLLRISGWERAVCWERTTEGEYPMLVRTRVGQGLMLGWDQGGRRPYAGRVPGGRSL
jgi:hypothetical protein